MDINTNRWNKIRYTLYLPFYDFIGKVFSASRAKAIALLEIAPQEKVLLIGAGTGLDIDYINKEAKITATDVTKAMVNHIKRKYTRTEALVMDGQKLDFPNNTFDKVILHLILAVIPDPVKCIQEAERVLKSGGKISVFDKFLEDEENPSLFRRIMNSIANALFSDINRKSGEILRHTKLKVIYKTKADFGGNFKILILEKE